MAGTNDWGEGAQWTDTKNCLLGFDTIEEMKYWLAQNEGRAAVAVAFGDTTVATNIDGSEARGQTITGSFPNDLHYELWYNLSTLENKWVLNAGADTLGAWASNVGSGANERGGGSLESS